jgi:hypothetical protein
MPPTTNPQIVAALKRIESGVSELRELLDTEYVYRLGTRLQPGWAEGTDIERVVDCKAPPRPASTREWVFESSDPQECKHETVLMKANGSWTCGACGEPQDSSKVRTFQLHTGSTT